MFLSKSYNGFPKALPHIIAIGICFVSGILLAAKIGSITVAVVGLRWLSWGIKKHPINIDRVSSGLEKNCSRKKRNNGTIDLIGIYREVPGEKQILLLCNCNADWNNKLASLSIALGTIFALLLRHETNRTITQPKKTTDPALPAYSCWHCNSGHYSLSQQLIYPILRPHPCCSLLLLHTSVQSQTCTDIIWIRHPFPNDYQCWKNRVN